MWSAHATGAASRAWPTASMRSGGRSRFAVFPAKARPSADGCRSCSSATHPKSARLGGFHASHREDARYAGAFPESRINAKRPAEGSQPVQHVLEPRAHALAAHIEAGTVVADREDQAGFVLPNVHRYGRGFPRVLAGVLESLEDAEVNRCLCLRRVACELVRAHRRRPDR